MPVKISLISSADLVPDTFLNRWTFKRSKEKTDVKRAATFALRKQARLHSLSINEQDYGFVAVDIHQLPKQKQYYLQILYLFVSSPYRSQHIIELDGMTASEYLAGYVISQALEIATFLPLNAIVLECASDKLIPLYESLSFAEIPALRGWMSLPLSPF